MAPQAQWPPEHKMSCPHCGGRLTPGGYFVGVSMPRILTRCAECRQQVAVPVVSSGLPFRHEPTDDEKALMRQFIQDSREE